MRCSAELVAATLFLIAAFLVDRAAQAQTINNTSDGKRVQVLRIVEAGSAKAHSVKKAKSSAAILKKKVARNRVGHTSPTAPDGTPEQIINPVRPGESATSVDSSVAPEQYSVAFASSEQTGVLAFGDRAVAFASFTGDENNIGFTRNDLLGVKKIPATAGPVTETSALPDGELARQADGSASPIPLILATLSGAMLTSGFAWYLIRLSRRRGSRELPKSPVLKWKGCDERCRPDEDFSYRS